LPAYHTRQQRIAIDGVDDLEVRSLRDRDQYDDPRRHAARLGISSATWPLFGWPWPSGLRLAAHLAERPVRAGERILELGCGLALPSLVAHRRGADVTASDCHPLAAVFLHHNLRLNGLPPMDYRHGQWNVPPRRPERIGGLAGSVVRGRFDLVIGSDLLYERDVDGGLARFIAGHTTPEAEVWIADPDRGNRSAFQRHMAAHGFEAHQLRLDRTGGAPHAAYKGRLLVFRRHTSA
jgi:predicted nicotinamide N-methyase